MTTWKPEELSLIERTHDLYVAPFREDGVTVGSPTQTWALVVDGNVYVRAANGPASRWYQAAVSQGAGQIRVAGTLYDVTFEAADDSPEAAIDAAYKAKYPSDPTSVRHMLGADPKKAVVRISPR